MGNMYLTKSNKSLKKAIILAIFSGILLLGLFFGQFSALGEGEVQETQEAPAQENAPVAEQTVIVDPNYQVIPVEQIPVEELEPTPGSMNEKVLSADAKIIWQKNSEFFGNFIPNKVYILEDSGNKFRVESVQEVTNEGGNVYNVFAFGVDQNEDNSYAFRLISKRGGKNWEPEFIEFISNFKK